jgi:hypothetical protein
MHLRFRMNVFFTRMGILPAILFFEFLLFSGLIYLILSLNNFFYHEIRYWGIFCGQIISSIIRII